MPQNPSARDVYYKVKHLQSNEHLNAIISQCFFFSFEHFLYGICEKKNNKRCENEISKKFSNRILHFFRVENLKEEKQSSNKHRERERS